MRWPLWRVKVTERSMEPGLRQGDWLLAWRGLSLPPGRPPRIRPGQVVLAWHPGRPGFLLVKRAAWRQDDGWWLESDNQRCGARDSWSFGAVPASLIAGRVLLRYRRGRPQTPQSPAPEDPGPGSAGGAARES